MARLDRMTVQIAVRRPNGTDPFGRPLWETTMETVTGCVVGAPSSEDVNEELNQSGKRIAYQVLIPKGDKHDWENTTVIIDGREYRTVGVPRKSYLQSSVLPCDQRIGVETIE